MEVIIVRNVHGPTAYSTHDEVGYSKVKIQNGFSVLRIRDAVESPYRRMRSPIGEGRLESSSGCWWKDRVESCKSRHV